MQQPKVNTARLSFGTIEVTVQGLENQEVTEATSDYLKWCEAALDIPLGTLNPQVLAFVANHRNEFQAAVRDTSPRSHANRAK